MAQDPHQQLVEAKPEIAVTISPRTKAGFTWHSVPSTTLKQVHGSSGMRVNKGIVQKGSEGDWLWTTELGFTIGIQVADCTAVLIYGKRKSGEEFVAAIHAGWRGTAKNIFEAFYTEVQPQEWTAWLSPRICQNHFEVGPEVLEKLGESSKTFAKPGEKDRHYLDLGALQKVQLEALGAKVIVHPLCTYHQPEFFSYRRSASLETGRHFAYISLGADPRHEVQGQLVNELA